MPLHLRIATLERTVFDEDIESVTLPGSEGEFTVLKNHLPLITSLSLGEIVARRGKEDFSMTVSGGMADVQPHRVLILADQAERAEEIDIELAEEARTRAEKLMEEHRDDAEEFAAAEAEMARALLRIKLAKRRKSGVR
ncbi:MAG: ATP synthase F1 subunit epsilon [Nanoarchaeota archaeon]|nr:ATP synthase F1 subunit epsilon [Nanoarchaeota archaeon]